MLALTAQFFSRTCEFLSSSSHLVGVALTSHVQRLVVASCFGQESAQPPVRAPPDTAAAHTFELGRTIDLRDGWVSRTRPERVIRWRMGREVRNVLHVKLILSMAISVDIHD